LSHRLPYLYTQAEILKLSRRKVSLEKN